MQLSRMLDCATVGYSTAQAAAEVDMTGFESCLCIGVICSSAARTASMALKTGATTTGFVTCASTFTNSSTAAGFSVVITDVHKVRRKFLGATLSTTTATPSVCLMFPYNPRKSVGNFTASGTNLGTANGGILRAVSPSSAT